MKINICLKILIILIVGTGLFTKRRNAIRSVGLGKEVKFTRKKSYDLEKLNNFLGTCSRTDDFKLLRMVKNGRSIYRQTT